MKSKTVATGKARSVDFGNVKLRMMPKGSGFVGRAFRAEKVIGDAEGESADAVWMALQDMVSKSDPRYVGFDGAISRFLQHYPGGFEDPHYLKKERDYKVRDSERLRAVLPEAVSEGDGFGEIALSAVKRTDLLSHRGEKLWLENALRSAAADNFMRSVARFTLEPSPRSIGALANSLGAGNKVNWVMATYLPFLWQPDRHMFLKPEITREFAARVGHRFDTNYESGLSYPVYASLLDLVDRTRTEVAALKPKDNIDIHTFIFVVGRYAVTPDKPV